MRSTLIRLFVFVAIAAFASAAFFAACGDDDNGPGGVTTSPDGSPVGTAGAGAAATATQVRTPPTSGPTATNTSAPAPARDLSGTWNGTYQNTNVEGSGTFVINWTQSGTDLSGTITVTGTPCLGDATITAVASGNDITIGAVKGAVTITYRGTVSGNTMSGTYQASPNCGSAQGTWSATKG